MCFSLRDKVPLPFSLVHFFELIRLVFSQGLLFNVAYLSFQQAPVIPRSKQFFFFFFQLSEYWCMFSHLRMEVEPPRGVFPVHFWTGKIVHASSTPHLCVQAFNLGSGMACNWGSKWRSKCFNFPRKTLFTLSLSLVVVQSMSSLVPESNKWWIAF